MRHENELAKTIIDALIDAVGVDYVRFLVGAERPTPQRPVVQSIREHANGLPRARGAMAGLLRFMSAHERGHEFKPVDLRVWIAEHFPGVRNVSSVVTSTVRDGYTRKHGDAIVLTNKGRKRAADSRAIASPRR